MFKKKNKETDSWDWEVKANSGLLQLNLTEVWLYKDLLFRFVRRDLLVSFQQTVLGPLWVFLQPLLSTLVYFIIFNYIARITTGNTPPILFYLPGVIIWNYFSESLNGTMYTFLYNSHIFSKVYFPRLIAPFSNVLTQTVRAAIQLLLFVAIYVFYAATFSYIRPSLFIFLLPLLVLLTALYSCGLGLIISVFLAKYRDLENVVQFALRLFMFAAPVVFPASIVPGKFRFLFFLNPLTAIIESFRASFFSYYPMPFLHLGIATVHVCVVFFAGVVLFKKREIKVMDIV